MNKGKISQVMGSTFDVQFEPGFVPSVYNALVVQAGEKKLYGEVQQHLGGGEVRAVALGSTLGLARGMEVVDTGEPVTVPVGEEILGRVFNLLGEAAALYSGGVIGAP